ncbi:MAG: LytTR family DNA-binding domain-containing protein [Maritimibacter sp.]|jgi:hypothetical protein
MEKQRRNHELQVYATNGSAYTVSLDTSWQIVTSKMYVWFVVLFSLTVAVVDAPVFDVDLPFVARFIYWLIDCVLMTGFWFVQARLMIWLVNDLNLPIPSIGAVYTAVNIAVAVWIDYWFSRQALGLEPLGALAVWGEVLRYAAVSLVLEILVVSFILPKFSGVRMESWSDARRPEVEKLQVNEQEVRLDELYYIKSVEHYVELVGDSGKLVERASLKHLIAQLGPQDGIQPHRSYWVSSRAEPELKRAGSHLVLALNCGVEIPVSRGRRKAVEQWLEKRAEASDLDTV